MSVRDQTKEWIDQLQAVRARAAPVGVASLADLRSRSGAEFFDAIGRGELPMAPIGETLDFWPVEWEPGRMVFQGTPAFAYYNPLGSVPRRLARSEYCVTRSPVGARARL